MGDYENNNCIFIVSTHTREFLFSYFMTPMSILLDLEHLDEFIKSFVMLFIKREKGVDQIGKLVLFLNNRYMQLALKHLM